MNPKLRRITALAVTVIMLLGITPLSTIAEVVKDVSGGFSLFMVTPLVHTKTYEFRNNGMRVDTQIVKNEQSLIAPATPDAEAGKKFAGWFVGSDKVVFNTPITVNTTETVTANAVFDDIFYLIQCSYSKNPNTYLFRCKNHRTLIITI